MRKDFQRFWGYQCPEAAEKFIENWGSRVLQTDLEPMKKVAQTLRNNKLLILNTGSKPKGDFKRRLSSGVVQGFSLRAKLTMRKY